MVNTIKAMVLPFAAIGMILLAAPIGIEYCSAQQQPEPQQGALPQDPILLLGLAPEQRAKIRTLREANKDERATINVRAREANRALEEVLNTSDPDEAVVEQRLSELAAAQAAQMRMRVLMEVRIRRVLTPEQQERLRTLRDEAKRQRQSDILNSNGRQFRRGRILTNRGNTFENLSPRGNVAQPRQPR